MLSVSPGGRLVHRPVIRMALPAWFKPGVLRAIAGVSAGDKGQHSQWWSWCEESGAVQGPEQEGQTSNLGLKC